MIAEWKGGAVHILLTKIAASASFLAIGLWNFGGSFYGILIVTALAFCLIGDVLLVWGSKAALFGGIAAFLVAHIAYAVAFAGLPFDPTAFVIALFIWNIVAVLLIRWLWTHLAGFDRAAVLVYMAVITVMVALAAATMSPMISVAAGLFAMSDISVARDRFIERGVVNKAWGVPLYYFAQVLLASSVSSTFG